MSGEKKVVEIIPGPCQECFPCKHLEAHVVFADGTSEKRAMSGYDAKQICEEHGIALPEHFAYMDNLMLTEGEEVETIPEQRKTCSVS